MTQHLPYCIWGQPSWPIYQDNNVNLYLEEKILIKSTMVEGEELLSDLMSWCQVGASWPQFQQEKRHPRQSHRNSPTIWLNLSGELIRIKVGKISVGLTDGAVWYNLLHLSPRRLENKWRAHLTRDWHDRQGGKKDLCVAFGRKITHFLVDAFDVLSFSVLLWMINGVFGNLSKTT